MKTPEQMAEEVIRAELNKHLPAVNPVSNLVINCQIQGNITSCGSCSSRSDEYECMDNLIFAYATLVKADTIIKM